jgi:NAD(P)-dependent dehydrogenase (short-subunit alcohol dehydrogenase family)
MSERLAGRVAVVTGAASGIGAATVRLFHREGACVVAADVQHDAGKAVVAALGDRALFVPTDVTREEDLAGVVDAAVSEFGRLDVMFNNAGVMGALGPIDQTSTGDADLTIAVNLRGVLLGMKHAARVMKPRRSGVILSTSSPAGVVGGVGPHVYSAVKAGVIGLSNSVAAELRPYGIRVNTIVPGAVVSGMTAAVVAGGAADLAGAEEALSRTAYMDRPLQPQDVAAGALYLASDEARYVTGVVLPVDAGMTGAGGPSPFASGRYAEPQKGFEAPDRTDRDGGDTA